MILLTKLAARTEEGELRDDRGTITALHDESVPGFFRSVKLNAGGLVISTPSGAAAGIPLAELLALAETHVPALVPPRLVPEAKPE